MPTPHFLRIREFMQKAGQETPTEVTIPDEDTRILRAKLILEEALETVTALGVTATVPANADGTLGRNTELDFAITGEPDLEEIVDGCADISVVTMGTLIAFGVDDEPVLEEVDKANLRKFAEGSYRREDGKWMKPPGWTKPDILGTVKGQGVLAD
ncbi:MAG: hypothetical protein HKN13_06345 [Rhodothermales bacterium]|nr:hypothetical protein [Rhodothermales bacterium]